MAILQIISADAISIWVVITLFLIGASLFIGFYIVNEFVIKLIRNRRGRATAKRLFPIITSAVWIVFIIYVAYRLIGPSPLIGLAILAILLIAFWRFVKDFISGFVFRIQDVYRLGQRIQLKDLSGVITRLHSTHVELETDQGERIMIPFSEFTSRVVKKPSIQQKLKQFVIQVKVPGKSLKDVNDMVLNCPWIIADKSPRVNLTDEGDFKISGHTLDLKYVEKIKAYFN